MRHKNKMTGIDKSHNTLKHSISRSDGIPDIEIMLIAQLLS
uniref:Uncharacterized protein n=1 Tax=Rhizophora mucronata TaxID=61149 RepID=A0A2P2QGM1_RHIMU